MWWILYGYYVMLMCGGQNSWFYKASVRICYVSLFECKNCYKLPSVEQRITKLDRKSTIYSVAKLSSYFCT